MPATAVLQVGDIFPAAATVGVYVQPSVPRDNGAPQGAASATAAVAADGSLTFTGLAFDTPHLAAALVTGVWRYVRFRTNPDPAVVVLPMDGVAARAGLLQGQDPTALGANRLKLLRRPRWIRSAP